MNKVLNSYAGYISLAEESPLLVQQVHDFALEPIPFDGMTLVEMKWIPMKNIRADFNKGRWEDACIKKQKAFSKVIKNGGYKPYHYVPPTVTLEEDGMYELQNGFHRYKGHDLADAKGIWVAVINLRDEATAIEYANYANIKDENDLAAEPRSVADLIKTSVASMKKRGIVSPTATDIMGQIRGLDAVSENKESNFAISNGIAKKFSVNMETISTSNAKGAARIYRDLNPNDVGSIHSQSYYPGSRDQSWRALQSIYKLADANGVVPSLVVNITQIHDSKSLDQARLSLFADMVDDLDLCKKIVEFSERGIITADTIKERTVYIPQSEKEVAANALVRYDDVVSK